MKKLLLVLAGTVSFGANCETWHKHTIEHSSLKNTVAIETILKQHHEQLSETIDSQSPGMAIGVISKGVLVHEQYYGLANIEHQVVISNKSKFYLASISKQITAAIIMLLELEQKLTREDPISKYLPELPPSYQDITIGQLLYHTSGVREYTSLMLFRGDDPSLQDTMSNNDAYRILQNQAGLDFPPGSQFRYSSSGYVLLAKLIEHVESQPFHKVAKNRVFQPLKMDNSLFDHDHSYVVSNRVDSYKYSNDQWQKWLKHFDVVGDGGLLTTLNDFFLWHQELTSGSTFGLKWQQKMHEKGALTNGHILNYGAGLQYDTHQQQLIIWHGGGMGAFIADYIQLPELDISIVVMANRNDALAFQGWKLAKTLIDNQSEAKVNQETNQLNNQLDFDFSEWLGGYFIYDRNDRRYLGTNADKQPAIVSKDGKVVHLLSYQGQHTFKLVGTDTTLRLTKIGKNKSIVVRTPEYQYTATAFNDQEPADISELEKLIGSYCNAELESKISVFQRGKELFYRYRQSRPFKIYPVEPKSRINWNSKDKVWVGYAMFKFGHDQKNDHHFLDMGDFRVSNVRFNSCN